MKDFDDFDDNPLDFDGDGDDAMEICCVLCAQLIADNNGMVCYSGGITGDTLKFIARTGV